MTQIPLERLGQRTETALFMAASMQQWFERGAVTDIEGSDAFGAVEFMRREGKKIHVHGFDVHPFMAAGID